MARCRSSWPITAWTCGKRPYFYGMAKTAKLRKRHTYEEERKAWVAAYRKVWSMIHAGRLAMLPCQECGGGSVRFIMVDRNFKRLNLRYFCRQHYDFAVGEGLRTLERQKQLLKEKKSQTLKSRHITGHAVDLWAWVNGTIDWEYRHYPIIAKAMKQASKELNIPIEWGGDWKTFKDGVHFQLPVKQYP